MQKGPVPEAATRVRENANSGHLSHAESSHQRAPKCRAAADDLDVRGATAELVQCVPLSEGMVQAYLSSCVKRKTRLGPQRFRSHPLAW